MSSYRVGTHLAYHYLLLVDSDGLIQDCPVEGVLDIGVGSTFEEQLDDVLLLVDGGPVEGSLAICVLLVEEVLGGEALGVGVLEDLLEEGEVAVGGDHVWGLGWRGLRTQLLMLESTQLTSTLSSKHPTASSKSLGDEWDE